MKKVYKKVNKIIVFMLCIIISFSQPMSLVAYAEEPIAAELSEDENTTDVTEETGTVSENIEETTDIEDNTDEYIELEADIDSLSEDTNEENNAENQITEDQNSEDDTENEAFDEADLEVEEIEDEEEESVVLNVSLSLSCKDGKLDYLKEGYIRASKHVQIDIDGDIVNSNLVHEVLLELTVDGEIVEKRIDFDYRKRKYILDTKDLAKDKEYNVSINKIHVLDKDGNDIEISVSSDFDISSVIACAYEPRTIIDNNTIYLTDEDAIFDQYGNPLNIFNSDNFWTIVINNTNKEGYSKADIKYNTPYTGDVTLDFHNDMDKLNRKYKVVGTCKAWDFLEYEINREFIVDKVKPNISFELYNEAGEKVTDFENPIFSSDITVKVIVEEYNIDSFKVIDQLDRELLSAKDLVSDGEGRYIGVIECNQDDNYSFDASCIDKVGYDSAASIAFIIDKTAPTVEITYNDITPQNGYYYNADRIAEITVTDKNFDTSKCTFEISNKYGNTVSLGDWTQSGDSYKCEAVFKGDDEYSGSFSCIDKAGNKSDVVAIERFVVDKTAPKISYSYDNTSAHKSNYYNASRIAKISVDDISFASKNVSLENNSDQSVSFSSWSGGGNNYTAEISCTVDGKYQFYVTATDLAGNTSEKIDCGTFIIDTVAPSIEITGVMDKSANAGTVIPVINCNDLNLDNDDSVITLSGYKNGVVNPSAVNLTNGSKKDVTYDVFKVEKAYDDIYTVTAVAEDMAGNTTEISYMFSVNRFGSTFGVTKPTADLIDKYYTNAEQDLVLLETNVDNVDEQQLYITKNGKNVKLKKGVDYFVEKEGNDATWKAYTYTINKKNFQDEGTYEVSLFTTDRAGNKSDSNAKGMTIKFAVDKTAPSIAVAGVEENNVYKMEKLDLNIDVQDNMEIGYAEIEIDGTVVKKYEAEELEDVVTYSIDESEKPMTVVVRAVDVVGNLTEKTYKNVTVSTLISDETVEMEDSDIPLGDSLDISDIGINAGLVSGEKLTNGEDTLNQQVDFIFYISIAIVGVMTAVGFVLIKNRRKNK